MRFLIALSILTVAALTAWACESDYTIWIPRHSSANPLYRFVVNEKAGYIDASGKVVIPPRLVAYGNYGSEFHDGLLETSVNGGEYVDRTGKRAIDKTFSRGWEFSEGLAVAMRNGENLWGYIDTSGTFAISPRFRSSSSDYVWSFSDGVAKIQANHRFGFIDHSGTFIIQPQFLDANDFRDGMARVVIEGPCFSSSDEPCSVPRLVGDDHQGGNYDACKFTFVDKTGAAVTTRRFDFARDFSEGLAPVRIDKLWGFIDKRGKLVIAPKFEDAAPFHFGMSRVRMNGKYGYANKSGVIVVKSQYEDADDFSEGLAVVGNRTAGYWYIDQHGEQAISTKFADASPFFKGLAHVRIKSHMLWRSQRFAYIAHTGRQVFTY